MLRNATILRNASSLRNVAITYHGVIQLFSRNPYYIFLGK